MKKALFVLILLFLSALPALAAAPVCLFTDVQSGPATGGEGGNGIYLSIYGTNFGSSQGTSKVTVNGTPVAQYLYWSTDPTGDRQQIGVQIASGTTGTGNIVVTTPGGSCSNLSFTVRSGHIYFVGPAADTSAPANCSTMTADNSYSSPWGLTNYASTNESSYNPSTMRTPYTYYECLAPGDTLVFMNGVNYPYFDGRGWHASLTPDSGSTSSSNFMTIMARPGATVQLGGTGWATYGIRSISSGYDVISGITQTGSGPNGGMAYSNGSRVVGNTVTCPDCWGPAGAIMAGTSEVLGNLITAVSTDTTVLPNGSNKTYHDAYFEGNNFEFAWNRIYNTAAYNGFQINQDGSSGFYNFSVHDNDIADVNGSGINLSDIDPSSGYVQVYNNIIHHTGVALASDGGADDPHSCIAVKGYGSATGAGTAEIYNNTMYDCSSILNASMASSEEGEACAVYIPPNQLNVTSKLVNNIAYQPSYTYSSNYNVFICGDGLAGTISGSNNIWYSASTPGSTAYATSVGTIENPLFVSATDGSWANFSLQSTSPAIGQGVQIGQVYEFLTGQANLTWDFNQVVRPSSPSIGALESGSTSSQVQITLNTAPTPAMVEQPVTLTAAVAHTRNAVPSGSMNFMNGSTSLGSSSLDSTGAATLVLSTLPAGSYSVVGAYSGDSNYPSAQSGAVPLQVQGTTTISLSASTNQVAAGQPLVLTATVSGASSSAGTVSFLNGSTLLGTAVLNSSGVATLSVTTLAVGTHSLTAQYTGSSGSQSSISAAVSVTVGAAVNATTTSLIATPNPGTAGQPVALTATVKGSGTTIPTGTVSFLNGSSVLGTATLNGSGVATISATSLGAGTYSMTATYTGNASFLASSSMALAVTVNGASATSTTTTALVASPNPAITGQVLSLKATVTASGTTPPTGTVSFLNGSTLLGTATLNSSGVATLSTSSLLTGTYNLVAEYAGKAGFSASNSPAVSVTVIAAAATAGSTTTTSLVASPNPVIAGQVLALTATVRVNGTNSPGGKVTFMNGSSVLGTASLNSSGEAVFSIRTLAAGTYSMTAEYSGHGHYPASTSPAVAVTVNAASAQIAAPFTLSTDGVTPTQTVLPGETAHYTFVVSPTTGSTLPAINFSVSGLPEGATATFSPKAIAAGSNATNVELSIQPPAMVAQLDKGRKMGGGLFGVALCLLLLPFGRGFRRSAKRMTQLCCMLLLLAGALSMAGLTGCATGVVGASQQTYNVTVTSTAGDVSQTANLMLTVE